MASSFEELEKEVRSLNSRHKATLAHILIEDLDTDTDENAEQLWIEEARRRYQAFKDGKVMELPGDEVMRRARQRLR
ncbi:MAG: acyl-protein synthetase [Proteobacteria bacterium]|nr:MAG: acyl-protein synthetase [Pseudomonadota bacterium]TDJ72082.1 MAG: acyl-protein synthetase [Pseudomonadota bacterium]